jgi:hypothetical protein
MPITAEIRAAGVDPTNVEAVLLYLGRLGIPRDRREGLLRLYMAERNQVPTVAQIEQVRSSPSP